VLKLQPAVIGFSLPPGALGRHSQADVYARIHAAAELARHHNIPVGVEGDIAAEHALRFAQDGVQHMASPRLWPVRSGLTAAELWHASRLTPLAKTENAA
jgi:pentose-5-phosphate-3-epimerase